MGGIEVIEPGFRVLYDRAMKVLGSDPRVKDVVVSGSVGAGTADPWSDLDLQVIAHPEHYDAFLAEWPQWLGEITPTVFARTPIAPFVINTVTADGLTFDLSVWKGEVPHMRARTRSGVGTRMNAAAAGRRSGSSAARRARSATGTGDARWP